MHREFSIGYILTLSLVITSSSIVFAQDPVETELTNLPNNQSIVLLWEEKFIELISNFEEIVADELSDKERQRAQRYTRKLFLDTAIVQITSIENGSVSIKNVSIDTYLDRLSEVRPSIEITSACVLYLSRIEIVSENEFEATATYWYFFRHPTGNRLIPDLTKKTKRVKLRRLIDKEVGIDEVILKLGDISIKETQ